jgi:3-deoxy-D-manno-octulosonic-acid transferase
MVHNLIRDFEKKGKKVFVSIFSPSAWEIVSKNEKYWGFIPIDKQKEIHHFVETINPKFVVIAKYDLWPVLSNVLYNKKIPYVIAFSQFHEHHHTLWKWNFLENKIYRRALGVGHQTQKSLELWQKSDFPNGFFLR